MDCRILRQLMLKSDGHLVCDDSSGYFITLGEVSAAPGWSIAQVLAGGVYAHVRRSFAEGRVPWPGICETCDLFSATGFAHDQLGSRIRIMVEPTLHCGLACPTCKRGLEGKRRSGSWTLDPEIFAALLLSCARSGIVVEEIHYLGWGEPLLHPEFARLTRIARELAPAAVQEVTTTGNLDWRADLADADLDRLVLSCDGVRQESYERFRRKGSLDRAFAFAREARKGIRKAPVMEWKYIVFTHNDGDEEILLAQEMADAVGFDSLLFILTNSKGKSERFDTGRLASFPLRSSIATVSPAAAMLKTEYTGEIVAEQSTLGEGRFASLYVDNWIVTESQVAIVTGWALGADLDYVERVELVAGNMMIHSTRPAHRRTDVAAARPGAAGPDCGFVMRVAMAEVDSEQLFLFAVKSAAGEETFRAHMRFRRAA